MITILFTWMGGSPNGGQSGNPILSFLPFVFIIAIIYFMMIRPQKKRQKEHDKLIASLGKGDKVVTSGGLHGTVQSTKEKSVIVKIADNVKVEIERTAITTLVKGSQNEGVAETETADKK